jgi:D-proline reductase (dithiol) PrdB
MNSQELSTKFDRWIQLVTDMHAEFRFTGNPHAAWTPVTKPLSAMKIGLLGTGGVHLKSQEPYDLMNRHGDWRYRLIPSESTAADLMASHTHYDTDDANRDINCIFPIDALRTLAAGGEIGGVSPVHIGMMGFIPNGEPLRDETAPAIARIFREAGADAVLMVPG